MYSVSVGAYIQNIFSVAGQGRYDIAPYVDEVTELVSPGIETDDALPHGAQVEHGADAGDIVVGTEMLVFYNVVIRGDSR